MKRRTFMGGASTGLLSALALESGLLVPSALAQNSARAGSGGTVLQLARKINPELIVPAYQPRPDGGRLLSASDLPYVYAMYDEAKKQFVNPLDIKPTLKKGSYTLTSTLQAFNIKRDARAQFTRLKNQIQLGFNATAPISTSEQLTWVFMNAVNIFLGKPEDRDQQLTKFMNNGKSGTPLQANPKVSVTSGLVSLQVTAFGQKKDGRWKKFFDILSSAVGSPIISDVSKGFGIPGLATQALQFVDHVIDVYTEQEKLVPLWQTGSLEFAVHQDAHARFRMNPGLWVVIDSDYAQASKFLEGHTVDLQLQSFRVRDKNGTAVDANYLVAELKFDPA